MTSPIRRCGKVWMSWMSFSPPLHLALPTSETWSRRRRNRQKIAAASICSLSGASLLQFFPSCMSFKSNFQWLFSSCKDYLLSHLSSYWSESGYAAMTQPHDVPWWIWLSLCSLAAIQGTWLFLDARKRSRYPWLWGLWGLTSIPTPLLVYLLVVRKIWKRGRKS